MLEPFAIVETVMIVVVLSSVARGHDAAHRVPGTRLVRGHDAQRSPPRMPVLRCAAHELSRSNRY
jgi:hypothetical protein